MLIRKLLTFQADDIQEAVTAFNEDTVDRQLLLNVEYKGLTGECASLSTNETDVSQRKDIAKELIADGLLCLENRREKRLQKLVFRICLYILSLICV